LSREHVPPGVVCAKTRDGMPPLVRRTRRPATNAGNATAPTAEPLADLSSAKGMAKGKAADYGCANWNRTPLGEIDLLINIFVTYRPRRSPCARAG
jgi:hypothetical protein